MVGIAGHDGQRMARKVNRYDISIADPQDQAAVGPFELGRYGLIVRPVTNVEIAAMHGDLGVAARDDKRRTIFRMAKQDEIAKSQLEAAFDH